MKILCAPDSFKGSLTAAAAAAAMARGIRAARPDAEIVECGVADGGEGTVATLIAAHGGRLVEEDVWGPRGTPVRAGWGWLGGPHHRAVVELAAASGLTLLAPTDRDPEQTSTYGSGQLCAKALDAGARTLLIGLGGTATHDGGCGLAQALGVRFLDPHGKPLPAPLRGVDLPRIAAIDRSSIHQGLRGVRPDVCCDVTNPLVGPLGAAAIYGPQKGARPEQVARLDAGLAHLADVWQRDCGVDVRALPGAGAAGGVGGGLVAMFDGRLRSGIDAVLEAIDFAARAQGADLCFTGEGRLDGQSAQGKACAGVARAAGALGIPTIGLFGAVAADAPPPQALGMRSVLAIGDGLDEAESMRRAADLLAAAAARATPRH